MAEVELRHVGKRYGAVEVVKDLSLHIAHREFLVLVGASGCGKSTTLRMVAGLESADSGDILIGARRVNSVPPKDRDVAMVFQNYALYPHLSVEDNIAFSMQLRRAPRAEIEAKVRKAADTLGLATLLARKPKELSGGQRQRVALARALVREPAVFLMDEPLSNLDAQLRAQTRVEIKKLHQRLGATIIYVTHDQTEAMTMGDRIAVMSKGEIAQLATPREVYEAPVNMFVAGFIGSPGMNFLRATVASLGAEGATLAIGTQRLVLPLADPTALGPLAGEPVVVGIRPEAVLLPQQVRDERTAEMKATVEVVEPAGARTYLHLVCEGMPLVADVDTLSAPTLAPGDEVPVRVNLGQVHVFDAATERTALHTARSPLLPRT
jgi:multiple sugar transport system ATP-binding protein